LASAAAFSFMAAGSGASGTTVRPLWFFGPAPIGGAAFMIGVAFVPYGFSSILLNAWMNPRREISPLPFSSSRWNSARICLSDRLSAKKTRSVWASSVWSMTPLPS
jgi:hypothetical protein